MSDFEVSHGSRFARATRFLRREAGSLVMLLMMVGLDVALFLRHRAYLAAMGGQDVEPSAPLPEWLQQDVNWELLLQTRIDLAMALMAASLAGLTLLLVGVFRLASMIDRVRRGVERLWPGRLEFRAPWTVWDVCRIAIVVAFIAHVVGLAQGIGEVLFPAFRLDDNARMLINTTMVDGLVLISLWLMLRTHRLSWRDIGLTFHGFGAALRTSVQSYIAAMPILLGVLLLTMTVVRLTGWEPPPQPVLQLIYAEERAPVVAYAMWFVTLMGPFIEELFFRGLAYNALKRRFGIGWGILLSGVIFSMLHADPVGFVPIAVLGMLLAYLYERTGSLLAPIVVHMAHNSLMVGFVHLMRAVIQATM